MMDDVLFAMNFHQGNGGLTLRIGKEGYYDGNGQIIDKLMLETEISRIGSSASIIGEIPASALRLLGEQLIELSRSTVVKNMNLKYSDCLSVQIKNDKGKFDVVNGNLVANLPNSTCMTVDYGAGKVDAANE